MITIFDLNVTRKELEQLRIYFTDKNEYLKHATKYTAYLDLSLLHKIRGNKSIHKLYMEKACESFPFFQELILKRFFNLI